MSSEEDRAALERARYLAQTTSLREPEALALAYRERGYSDSGAAARPELDTSSGTVATYMNRVVAEFGPLAAMVKPEGERGDLQPITREKVEALPRHLREVWLDAAESEPGRVPAECTSLVEKYRPVNSASTEQ